MSSFPSWLHSVIVINIGVFAIFYSLVLFLLFVLILEVHSFKQQKTDNYIKVIVKGTYIKIM